MSWWGPVSSWTGSDLTAVQQQQRLRSVNSGGSSVALFGEDLLERDKIEDAAVDELLTQFPTYGTAAATKSSSAGSIVTATTAAMTPSASSSPSIVTVASSSALGSACKEFCISASEAYLQQLPN